jgi:predicted regulator of Ras-like GTPase activity (Roadblock/LC7/MglB family)
MIDSIAPTQETGENTLSLFEPELEDIWKIRGVGGAFLIRNDGTIITKTGGSELDAGGLSASSLRLVFESGFISDRIRDGPLSQIFIEFKDRILMIQEINQDRYLAVIARADANIGRINYHVSRLKQMPATAA